MDEEMTRAATLNICQMIEHITASGYWCLASMIAQMHAARDPGVVRLLSRIVAEVRSDLELPSKDRRKHFDTLVERDQQERGLAEME